MTLRWSADIFKIDGDGCMREEITEYLIYYIWSRKSQTFIVMEALARDYIFHILYSPKANRAFDLNLFLFEVQRVLEETNKIP